MPIRLIVRFESAHAFGNQVYRAQLGDGFAELRTCSKLFAGCMERERRFLTLAYRLHGQPLMIKGLSAKPSIVKR